MAVCPHCDKPAPDIAAVCPHCAGRLGSAVERQHHVPVDCPVCEARCELAWVGVVQLDICAQCKGLWFDRDELERFGRFAEDGRAAAEAREALDALGLPGDAPPAPTYLPCPVCEKHMTRTNYARVSGIMVHPCRDHGTWAEHASARSLLGLFEDEGVDTVRGREANFERARVEQELGRLRAEQQRLSVQTELLDRRGRWHLLLDWFHFL